jgi:hypothetical protein
MTGYSIDQPIRSGSDLNQCSRAVWGAAARERRTRLGLLAMLSMACLASGCVVLPPTPAPHPYRVELAPGYDPVMCRRLLFLPVVGLEQDPVAATIVSDALISELQTVGPFEVLLPDPIPCPECAPPGFRPPNEAEVAEMAQRYQADALVFTTVSRYNPYPPLQLGLSIEIVGVSSNQTLARIDTLRFADEDIPFSNGDCTLESPADEVILAGARVATCSPRYFSQHVAAQIAHALALNPVRPAPFKQRWFTFWQDRKAAAQQRHSVTGPPAFP